MLTNAKPETLITDSDKIPSFLKAIDRWVLWRWEEKGTRWAKTPRQTNGRYAATNDPHTWSTFDAAEAAFLAGDFDGMGLVLPPGIVGVDLDDCLNGQKEMTQEAKLITAMLPSYAEISPSGTGLKIFVAGRLDDDLQKICRVRGVEMYDGASTNRFFTITGAKLPNAPPELHKGADALWAIQSMMTDPPKTRHKEEGTSETISLAITYLEALNPDRADNYHEWLQIGMALAWCDKGDEMLDRWIEFSSQSPKFQGEEDCRRKWETFKRENGRLLTLGYLEKLAHLDGYSETQFRAQFVTAADLAHKKIERDYLIDDFLVANEPMIVGGASKTLKTSVTLDLAISLASGKPFLNHFEVKQPHRLAFISGESGESTLQENLIAICRAKGISPGSLHDLLMGFKLPKLDDTNQVEDLISELEQADVKIVVVDPLYRSLRVGESASNVYSMGEKLELIAERIHRRGITTLLCHHFRKQGRSHEHAPELEDLSQSGVAEFGRQFLLLKRRTEYKWDGKHDLWFHWGGSAGHQGMKMLSADTGTRSTGIIWQARLESEDAWKANRKEQDALQKEMEKEDREREKREKAEEAKGEIFAIVEKHPGLSTNEILAEVGGRKKGLSDLLELLESEGLIRFEPGARNSKRWFLC